MRTTRRLSARILAWPRPFVHEVSELPRWAQAVAGALVIAACALSAPRGGAGAVLVVLASVVLALLVTWLVAAPSERRWVLLFALLAIAGREALMGAIDVALLSRGNVWYAPDEHIYIERAFAIWQHWAMPALPFNDSDPYNASWYVHGMAHLYTVLGRDDVVAVKAINTLLGVVSGLLCYRVMRNLGMPGTRWALVLVLAFPSIILWSALALKDSFVLFFLIASAWAASEFVRTRNYLWLPAAILVLVPIDTVRTYMLVTGAVALLAVPFAVRRWRDRLLSGGAIFAGVYLLFGFLQPFADLGANIFYIPIYVRGSAAEGARSAFVTPFPVLQGIPGERYQIAVPSGAPTPPETTPRVIVVQPGTQIQVVSTLPSGTTPSGSPGASPTPALVRPGDIIVVAGPTQSTGPSPTPSATSAPPPPTVIEMNPETQNIVGLAGQQDPDQASATGSVSTNLRHLPVGVLYTLFAPFPWTARTLEQFGTIPEMLLWYVCLVLAVAGFGALLRRRDLRFAQGVAMIIGLVLVLSLISANVGTLIRSRAMLIPYVLILSGVGIDIVLARYPSVGARLRWLRRPQ